VYHKDFKLASKKSSLAPSESFSCRLNSVRVPLKYALNIAFPVSPLSEARASTQGITKCSFDTSRIAITWPFPRAVTN
jgi:hypothetical protein